MKKLTKLENETIIRFNEAEKFVEVGTRSKRIINHMQKQGKEPERSKDGYYNYEVPVNWVKIRPPRKVSELQRKKASQRMQKINNRKKMTKQAKKEPILEPIYHSTDV